MKNWSVGSTAVNCVVTISHVFIAHIGDSKCLFVRSGELVYATRDHRGNLPEESERIKQAKGCVENGYLNQGIGFSRQCLLQILGHLGILLSS